MYKQKSIKKTSLYIIVVLSLFVSCTETSRKNINPKSKDEEIKSLLDFFINNAYQSELGTYYSEVNNTGEVVSGKVFNVALSRLIYGLSYSSIIDSSNLKKAQEAANFQMDKLIAKDSLGPYFVSFFDLRTNMPDSSLNLDIWQQAYGLCGLSELYRNSPNEDLLSRIHQFHDSFLKRFYDDKNGGVFGNYEKNEKVEGSKTLQSLIYPITAYMENLWSADTANRYKYEPYLKENIRIAFEKGWNKDLGWVNTKFDDNWNPCQDLSPDSTCFNVTPGHNFQFASVLLRARHWDFLTKEEQMQYRKLGMDILITTLNKSIFPVNDLSQGFYSEVNRVTNEVMDKRKTWWQHCEALIALSLTDDKFEVKSENLKKFYFNTFPDRNNGGEFFFVDENNIPQIDELKGSIGKSAYHTIEMIRFLEK